MGALPDPVECGTARCSARRHLHASCARLWLNRNRVGRRAEGELAETGRDGRDGQRDGQGKGLAAVAATCAHFSRARRLVCTHTHAHLGNPPQPPPVDKAQGSKCPPKSPLYGRRKQSAVSRRRRGLTWGELGRTWGGLGRSTIGSARSNRAGRRHQDQQQGPSPSCPWSCSCS